MAANPGEKYGKLTLISKGLRLTQSGRKLAFWLCRCDCGESHHADESNLKRGIVKWCKSCAHIARGDRKRTHGMSGDHGRNTPKIYYTWSAMKRRCSNPKDSHYANYGGRGITVCQVWQDSFEQFMADIGLPPTPKHTIERIDTNGNYEPGNVRWATVTEQANNKRNNHMLTKDGRTQTLAEWCRELGLAYATANRRLQMSGGDVEYALRTDKVKKGKGKTYTVDGVKYGSLAEVSDAFSMSVSGCHTRFKSAAFPAWIAEDDSPNY